MAVHPEYADYLPYREIHPERENVVAWTLFILQSRGRIAVFLRIEHNALGR
jgi:hypothetical protein